MRSMWSAHPIGWLARSYAVEENGRRFASLDFAWSGSGAIELDRQRLRIWREGFWFPEFHLEGRRERLATGRAAGAFRRGFYVAAGDAELRLDPSSWLGRSFDLTRRGELLGRIVKLGFFERRFQVEIEDELAPELSLFALWLVVRLRRRAH